MSDKTYIVFDENGIPVGVGDATEMAKVQRQFFLDVIDLIGDDAPDVEDVMPLLQKMPGGMIPAVTGTTISQLLSIISRCYDVFEKHGVADKAGMRARWHEVMGGDTDE